MNTLLKVLVALTGISLGGLGVGWIVAPNYMAADFSIHLDGLEALNQVRGSWGGALTAFGTLCALGLLRSEARWLYPVAIFLGFMLVGRVLGFVLDGMTTRMLVFAITEVAMIIILLAMARVFERTKGPGRD